MKMGNVLLPLLLGLSFITVPAYGATDAELQQDANDRKVQKAFQSDMQILLNAIKKNKNYDRIPLDTKESEEWFTLLAFRYWDHNVSSSEFVEIGLEKYPSHRNEFEFVAEQLPRRR